MIRIVVEICFGALVLGLTTLVLVFIFGIIYNMFHK